MLKVPAYLQTPSFCGPACLRMVFAYYGIPIRESTIATIAKSSREEGTPAENMVEAARHFNFHARLIDNNSISKIQEFLRKKVPVIVNWWSGDDGHYSVVVGLGRTHIHLRDPERKALHRIKREVFERCWFDFEVGKSPRRSNLILQRMIVIEK